MTQNEGPLQGCLCPEASQVTLSADGPCLPGLPVQRSLLGPTLQASVMIVVVSAMVACFQISILKAGTSCECTLGWAQQGQRINADPIMGALWFRTSEQRPFFHPQTWAVGRGGPYPGNLGMVVGLSPLAGKTHPYWPEKPCGLQEKMLP